MHIHDTKKTVKLLKTRIIDISLINGIDNNYHVYHCFIMPNSKFISAHGPYSRNTN